MKWDTHLRITRAIAKSLPVRVTCSSKIGPRNEPRIRITGKGQRCLPLSFAGDGLPVRDRTQTGRMSPLLIAHRVALVFRVLANQ